MNASSHKMCIWMPGAIGWRGSLGWRIPLQSLHDSQRTDPSGGGWPERNVLWQRPQKQLVTRHRRCTPSSRVGAPWRPSPPTQPCMMEAWYSHAVLPPRRTRGGVGGAWETVKLGRLSMHLDISVFSHWLFTLLTSSTFFILICYTYA